METSILNPNIIKESTHPDPWEVIGRKQKKIYLPFALEDNFGLSVGPPGAYAGTTMIHSFWSENTYSTKRKTQNDRLFFLT